VRGCDSKDIRKGKKKKRKNESQIGKIKPNFGHRLKIQ
jgi:hypothetical protein